MELFSEVYGCYYTVVSRVLNEAQEGMSRSAIEQLVDEGGFYESAFYLLPSLFSGEWNLLRQEGTQYFSKLAHEAKRPLTTLEKAWLKALIADARIQLFLDALQIEELERLVGDVEALYQNSDFHFYDRHLDGDDFESPSYALHFKTVLKATQEQKAVQIEYEGSDGKVTDTLYYPYKLSYSSRDDKFRLLCASSNKRKNRLQRVTLNLARIRSVSLARTGAGDGVGTGTGAEAGAEAGIEAGTVVGSSAAVFARLEQLFAQATCEEPVVFEISRERNALERAMLQFASYKRQTVYDQKRDIYTCSIWYDSADETELLIRILSFGPVLQVVGPQRFLEQLKTRISRQLTLNQQ
ncbi:MAG: WYL domain-containing protein [Coriobacteriia bacterium]|nr:WYL domain-containing protein [Coriobacteriia bacterium]